MSIIKQYHKDTNTTYVYESESYWDPELKQARSKRKCIGKVDPVTGEIIPTGKRGRKNKTEEKNDDNGGEAYAKLLEELEKVKQENKTLSDRIKALEKELSIEKKELGKYQSALNEIKNITSQF